MALIRASCEACGDVELTTADVHVRVCTSIDHGEYSFRCPICEMVTVKSAEPRTIDLLVASGVSKTTWVLPAELFEARSGEPISHDDLIDFHRILSDEGELTRALGAISDAL